jgi:pyruvate dehydrogenase E1 component alpha subunit
VAFFGEGAMNQGMLLESLNLAAAWKLPVLFVCKDDGWAITTRSERLTGGAVNERVRGFGIPALDVDGWDVSAVRDAGRVALDRGRGGSGPTFIHARCVHFEGHFLGYQLLRMVRDPLKEMPAVAVPITRSLLRPGGAAWSERLAGLRDVLSSVISTLRDSRRDPASDPLRCTRDVLLSDSARLQALEDGIEEEIRRVLDAVLSEAIQ